MILYYIPFVKNRTYRNVVLLLASLFFYAWGEPVFVALMVASIFVNWLIGLQMDHSEKKKSWLVLSVVWNLSLMFVFKYLTFVLSNMELLLHRDIVDLTIPLPLGISFFTFQILSYIFDLYYGKTNVQKKWYKFALYVSMFPQLVAGPIVRYDQIAYEIDHRQENLEDFSQGMTRFVYGLGKKVLLSNYMGVLADNMFYLSGEGSLSVGAAWIGAIGYTLQIYYDFSGYSDMAIGLGAILGFHFPENFNYPYIAASVKDFWHRWHISLSTWFKEYVYIPLGGNRKGLPRQILNILIVWTLTGIWHGAGWNFLFWGLWFALFLILEKLFLGELLKNAPVVFGRVYTLAVVLISWVFFALEKPGEILAYLQAMFGLNGVGLMNTQAMFLGNEYLVLLIIALVACLPVGSLLVHRLKSSKTGPAMALYRVGEKVIPAALLILSVAYIVDASYNPFLYFRF